MIKLTKTKKLARHRLLGLVQLQYKIFNGKSLIGYKLTKLNPKTNVLEGNQIELSDLSLLTILNER